MKKIGTLFILMIFWLLPLLLTIDVTNVYSSTKMPFFALENVVDGKIVQSKSFKNKVLLVSFFATWCPPCKEEAPILVRLQNELSADGFSVIALSVDQGSTSKVVSFVKKNQINYPVLIAESKTAVDFGGVYGIPVAFLVNKSGNVVRKYTGLVGYKALNKDIRSLLN